MYLDNMYHATKENKTKTLFRPWDSSKKDSASRNSNINQDSTVSSTAEKQEQPRVINEQKQKLPVSTSPQKHKNSDSKTTSSSKEQCGFRPVIRPELNPLEKKVLPTNNSIPPISDCCNMSVDPFSVYPEMLHGNIVQSLGLSPNDPLFLESLAQGYALEEYARVLSQEQQHKLLNSKKQRPKKYKCPHCDVGFSNNGQLKGHIRIHTGERPFKCEEKDCGKTFTRNEELTRHKRIHSGLRPYPCSHCGKRFGRKDHLKKHSRTHFQSRGVYAVPVMLPFETWAATSVNYPYVPMYGY